MTELKKCPFCGSEAKTDDVIGRYVYCPNPDCHMWRLEGEEIEIDEWQSRPLEDALQAKLDDVVASIMVVLDCVDYTVGNCRPNEPVGGVLPKEVIVRTRAALQNWRRNEH
jgi:hypothetical protein